MGKKLFIIWITKACNLNCTYCYETCKENVSMTKKVVVDTADYIMEVIKKDKIKICDIHFHGGEPLLEIEKIKYFIRRFDEIKECVFNYSVTTNGTLLTEEMCNYLNKKFNTISVSIDGKKESHDSQRVTLSGNGTFDKIMKRIYWLKMNDNLRIRMTVNTKNVRDFYENVSFLLNNGFRWIDPAIDFFDNWTEESVEILEKSIIKMKKYFSDNNIEQIFDLISTEFYKMSGCFGGRKNINIDIYGNIYPCSFSVGDSELCIGNVNVGILKGQLEKIDLLSKKPLEECSGCVMKKYCITSNCRILQYEIEHDWNRATPIFCILQHIKLHLWKDERKIK